MCYFDFTCLSTIMKKEQIPYKHQPVAPLISNWYSLTIPNSPSCNLKCYRCCRYSTPCPPVSHCPVLATVTTETSQCTATAHCVIRGSAMPTTWSGTSRLMPESSRTTAGSVVRVSIADEIWQRTCPVVIATWISDLICQGLKIWSDLWIADGISE